MGSTRPMRPLVRGPLGRRLLKAGDYFARSIDGFPQVALVQFHADEADAELGTGDSGRAEPGEGVGDEAEAVPAVQPKAHLREFGRERRRMWPILLAALDGLVGNEPGIA